MASKILILTLVLLMQSCIRNEKELGNIEIYETIEAKQFKKIYFYFVGFEKLNLDIKIILRNKLTLKESVLEKNLIGNENLNKNLILKEMEVKTSIRNDIIFEIKDLTKLVYKYIGSSEYCVIFAESKNGKIDISFSFRSSPPDFYVGKENPYYKNRDK